MVVSTSAPDSISLRDAETCTLTKLPKDVVEVMRKSDEKLQSWEAKLLVAHCLNLTKFPDKKTKGVVTKKILSAKGQNQTQCEPGMRILCETWRTEAIEAIKTLESAAEEELVVFELLTAISDFILNCTLISNAKKLNSLKAERDIDWENGLNEISAVCNKAIPRQKNALFLSCNKARTRLRQIRAIAQDESSTKTDIEQKPVVRKATEPVEEEAVPKKPNGALQKRDKEAEKKRLRREKLMGKLPVQATVRAQQNQQAPPTAALPRAAPIANATETHIAQHTGSFANPRWGTSTSWLKQRNATDSPIPWINLNNSDSPSVNPVVQERSNTGPPDPRRVGSSDSASHFASATNVGVLSDNQTNVRVHNNQTADAKRGREYEMKHSPPPQKQARYDHPPPSGSGFHQGQKPEPARGRGRGRSSTLPAWMTRKENDQL